MSDETQAPEAGAEQTDVTTTPDVGGQPAGLDLSNIEQSINERLSSFERSLSQALEQRQQTAEPEDDLADLYDYAEPLGLNVNRPQEDDTATLRALAELSDARARQVFEGQLSPQIRQLEERIAQMQSERDIEQLKQQYPKLQDPTVETAVVDRLMSALPQGVVPTRDMVGLAYRAWEADQMASGEGSGANTQQHQLEGPGGAAPEASELSWSDRLTQQAAPSKGAQFWGF